MRSLTLALVLTSVVSASATAAAATDTSGQMRLRGFQLLASSVNQSTARMPSAAESLPPHVVRATRVGPGEMPSFTASVPRLAKGFAARGSAPSSFRDLRAMRPSRAMVASRPPLPRGVTVFRPGWGSRPTGMRPARFARTVVARPAVRPPLGQRSALRQSFTTRVRSPNYRGR